MLQPLTSAPILLLNLKKTTTYNSLLYELNDPKYVRFPAAANVFIYFYLNNTFLIGLLKTEVGLFNLLLI